MRTSFDVALAYAWRPDNDGQDYHVTPGDAGGGTNHGVIEATWAHAVATGSVHGALRTASLADLRLVLLQLFWVAPGLDLLPRGVDLIVFDMGMAAGPGRAARLLQRTLGVAEDGDIGPGSRAALHRWDNDLAGLSARLTAADEAFFAACRDARRFLRGWTRRAKGALAEADKLITVSC